MAVVAGVDELVEDPVVGDDLADLHRSDAIGEMVDLVLDSLDGVGEFLQ